jgi:hypothetical protein
MMRIARQAAKTIRPTTGARSDASTKVRGALPDAPLLGSAVELESSVEAMGHHLALRFFT